jgi:hypothetical protein
MPAETKILFLGNNDESTDSAVTDFAQQTSIYHSNGKSCRSSIDSILQYYSNNPECNLKDLKDFFDYNDKLDHVRKTKLADFIPELDQARNLIT